MSDKVLFIKDKNEVIIQGVSFKCPNNWIMCPMSEADLEFANGNYAEKYPKKEEILSAGVPFFRANNIKDGYIIAEDMVYISKEKHEELQRGHLKTGDVIIAIRGNIGKSGMITEVFEGANLNAQLSVIRSKDKEKIIPAYINYMCLSPMLQMQFEVYTTGTALKQLSEKNLHSCIIAIPPIAEQQRIVEQIESLFKKLDEAKEKAEEVVNVFEKKKASILFKAFTGKLSERWRDEHKVDNNSFLEKYEKDLVPVEAIPCEIPKTWCWVKMGALGYTNIGLTYKPSDVSDEGTIVLRSSNIQGGKMDYSDIVRVNMNVPENKMCQKGDLLICARNGSKALVGKTAIVDEDGMSYGAFMAIFRSEYNRYIYYFMSSPFFRNLIDSDVSTTTINQVTQALIKNLEFPLAPPDEQNFIVKQLDELIGKEIKIKETAIEVIDKIELMKKSILAKAFRGELGTNNPDEESAINLLKQIITENL